MDWVKLAARPAFYLDGALLRAGEAAEVLFIRGLAHCGGSETGGVIDKMLLPMVCPRWEPRAAALVREGLWLDEGDHYRIRSWDDYQDAHDALALRREAERKRQRQRRKKAAELLQQEEMSRDASRDGHVTPSVTSRDSHADVTLLTRTEKETEERTTSSLSRKRERPAEPSPFDAFWTVYPRRIGKQAARVAYAKAKQRGATDEELRAAAQRFAEDPTRDPAYTPHPATWLNQGRHEDEAPARAQQLNPAEERHRRNLALVQHFAAQDSHQPELGA